MTSENATLGSPSHTRRRITIERNYQAPIQDVWNLWTTKEGIESWWGPDGFSVKVRRLDVRPGGELHYDMTATAPPQVEFMKKAGISLTTQARIRYAEVTVHRRLVYTQLADFVPEVSPYDVSTTVELHRSGQSVRMVLTFDAMHNEEWTQMAISGREGELGKLDKVLAR